MFVYAVVAVTPVAMSLSVVPVRRIFCILSGVTLNEYANVLSRSGETSLFSTPYLHGSYVLTVASSLLSMTVTDSKPQNPRPWRCMTAFL